MWMENESLVGMNEKTPIHPSTTHTSIYLSIYLSIYFSPSAPYSTPAKAGVQPISFSIYTQSWLRSFQDGFVSSISLVFHALFHFLSCFSLNKALLTSLISSKCTREWVEYLLENPETTLF